MLLGVLLSLASAAQANDEVWHPVVAGCHAQSVDGSLRSWREAPHSTSSLRLAVAPDGGRGPTVLVAMDEGLNKALQADGQPILIAAVGDRFRTCVYRMPLSACDAAGPSKRELLSLRVSAGYGFDADFTVRLHATNHFLQWSDGSGNDNALEYSDPGHPVSVAVAKALAAMEACWAPAMQAFKAERSD
jgi:hypothetical protein